MKILALTLLLIVTTILYASPSWRPYGKVQSQKIGNTKVSNSTARYGIPYGKTTKKPKKHQIDTHDKRHKKPAIKKRSHKKHRSPTKH